MNPPLQNATQVIKTTNEYSSAATTTSSPSNGIRRTAPVVPPLPPRNSMAVGLNTSSYNMNSSSYLPYSSVGYNSPSYGTYNSYNMMPYRAAPSIYNSYGTSYGGGGGYTANNYGSMYGMGVGAYPPTTTYTNDDTERRFIQYAEESSRNTFANVEGIVRAVNSISMMLDNTFFAMTSSFRAVLSVAENFGRLRNMFGHIWYSINVFRLFNWLYRRLMALLGRKVPHSAKSMAWNQAAAQGGGPPVPPNNGGGPPSGSNWPTLAFLGVLISAPYIISKFLPKYEDKGDPVNWKSPGIKAKAAFDFVARNPNELTVQTNDIVMLAPPQIQHEMNLVNSDWAFAVSNGKSGIVPLNYLLNIDSRRKEMPVPPRKQIIPSSSINMTNGVVTPQKTHTKRVSFGENQIFENFDLDDYIGGSGVTQKKLDDDNNRKVEKHQQEDEEVVVSVTSDSVVLNNNNNNNVSAEVNDDELVKDNNS